MRDEPQSPADRQLTMLVVDHLRKLIENGALKPGDKIPAEREFAKELNISRASLRAGIGYMAAMGILKVRHGVGAFVADGPPQLGNASLAMMNALHGFQPWQMFEARMLLEGHLAALAAERGKPEDLSAMAEEVTDMYASMDDPQQYLIHDVRFHRKIAEASGNPVLAALMETITGALYDDRRPNVQLASDRRAAADMHREIFHAISSRDAIAAREKMVRHLTLAEQSQKDEKLRTKRRLPASRRSVPRAPKRLR